MRGKQILAWALSLALLVGMLPGAAFAAEEGPPCENHQQHDGTCGYVEGSPCGHTEHTAACYTDTLICGFDGEAEQTATDSDADTPHEHTQDCYALDCPHERGVHDDTCGYVEAQPCGHECELCAPKDKVNGGEADREDGLGHSGTTGETSGQNVQKSTDSNAIPAPLANNALAAPVSNGTIDGNGYSFDPNSRTLTISSNDGTTAWRSNTSIAKTAVTSVVVQDGVTEIGSSAFYSCSNLEQASLPDSLETIGGYAFDGCSNLAPTSLPDNVISIEDYAFYNCDKLALTSLPAKVTSIGEFAFAGCSKLALTSLPEKLTSIEAYTFYGCSNLALTSLPPNLTSIKETAFYGCSKLALTVLPEKLTSIGDYAFQYCTGLTSLTLTNTTAPTLGADAFEGIPNLAIFVPDGASGYSAANNWPANQIVSGAALSGLTISEGNLSFHPATKGYSVTVPNSVGSVTVTPTAYASETITVNTATVASGSASGPISLTAGGTTDIAVIAKNSDADSRTYTIAVTRAGTTSTPGYSFVNGKLTITTNDGTTAWRSDPGIDLTAVTSVVVQDGVTEIGAQAFMDCAELVQADLPDSLTTIGMSAFFGCGKLNLSRLPNNVTEIGLSAFYECTSLALTELPPGLTKINDNTFVACKELNLSKLPDNVTHIAANAFLDCPKLALTKLPDKLISIYNFAFQDCTSLALTELPSSVNLIDWNAFRGCTGITSLTLRQTTAPTLVLNAFTNKSGAFDGIPGLVIYVPYGATGYDAGGWLEYADKIASGAALSGLTISEGTLAFHPATKNYSVTVPNSTGSVTVTPTAHGTETITVKGTPVASGTASAAISLQAGGNTDISIIAKNNDTDKNTYTITVTREGPSHNGGGGGGSGNSGSSYGHHTLTDKPTGLQVEGNEIHDNATLTVKPRAYHKTGDAGCDLLRTADKAGRVLSLYDVSLSRVFLGNVTVSIPVEGRDGQSLTVAHCVGGKLTLTNVTVKNGRAAVTAAELSPFAVLNEVYTLDTLAASAAGNPFTDVKESDWFYKAVLYAYQNGLMNGTTATTFDPLGAVTRAQAPVVLYRLEGSPAVTAQNPFTDVAAGQWYAPGVTWAAGAGIVDGYNANTYGPGDPVTREQLAVMLWRYAKYKGWDVSMGEDTNILSYADAAEISEWAIPAFQWACGAGIMDGTTAGRLAPKAGATRAELAQMLQRLLEKYKQPAAPVNPNTGTSRARRVRVQKGDTLSGLAGKYNTTVAAIIQANPIIKDPNFILPGWEIDIP